MVARGPRSAGIWDRQAWRVDGPTPASRTETTRVRTVTLRTVLDWVVRFDAAGGAEGLVDRSPAGFPLPLPK